MAPHIHPTEFYRDVAAGKIAGHSIVHRYGHTDNVTTTLKPVSGGEVYQMPTALTSLEIVSSNINDTSAGTGARTVQITGLSTNWTQVQETVTLNGVTPVPLVNQYFRVTDVEVVTSGSYADASTPSHAGNITLRVSGAGATWAIIQVGSWAYGQGRAAIGSYTIPAGKTAQIINNSIHVDSNQASAILVFYRENADTVAAPFTPMMSLGEFHGVPDRTNMNHKSPGRELTGPCDILTMAVAGAATSGVSFNMDLLEWIPE